MQQNIRFTAKNLVYGALFAALAIVFGRFTAVYPVPGAKYTLDKFILFLSGMFFGPLAGGMIGFERGYHGRAAGLRTHILVCLGATLTSMTGVYAYETLGFGNDPLRIAAQVAIVDVVYSYFLSLYS